MRHHGVVPVEVVGCCRCQGLKDAQCGFMMDAKATGLFEVHRFLFLFEKTVAELRVKLDLPS